MAPARHTQCVFTVCEWMKNTNKSTCIYPSFSIERKADSLCTWGSSLLLRLDSTSYRLLCELHDWLTLPSVAYQSAPFKTILPSSFGKITHAFLYPAQTLPWASDHGTPLLTCNFYLDIVDTFTLILRSFPQRPVLIPVFPVSLSETWMPKITFDTSFSLTSICTITESRQLPRELFSPPAFPHRSHHMI